MILNQLALYSPECISLLKQALEVATVAAAAAEQERVSSGGGGVRPPRYQSKYADSSDDEDNGADDKLESSSSSSEDDDDDDEQEKSSQDSGSERTMNQKEAEGTDLPPIVHDPSLTDNRPVEREKKKKNKVVMDQRQKEILIRKHLDSIPCSSLPLNDAPPAIVEIPLAYLSKDTRHAQDVVQECKSFLSLATDMQEKPVIVLFLRSGKFAGAVYRKDKCVTHRTHQRYTIRGKQGKAQSSQDAQRRPKSVGSQLRRAGEVALQEDVRQTLTDWKQEIQQSAVIWISCPRTMQKSLFQGVEAFFNKSDPRIRRVPLDMGKPTFENVNLIHSTLSTVTVRQVEPTTTTTSIPPELCEEPSTVQDKIIPKVLAPGPNITHDKQIAYPPLAVWHVAAKNGDIQVVRDLLSLQEGINDLAGEDFMSPLHFAAESTNHGVDASIAADCVYEMIVQGKADPCLVDARNRPPYFLAAHERVRDAFRRARAKLGEAHCSWETSKVGPPLTEEDHALRKEKEAEKRRKKRAKQKDKKQKEKSIAEEMEQKQKEEEERLKQEAEAKRIRDGLQPKTTAAGNVCDFCLKECKGRRRNQMFRRLDYAYCSTECVQKHKRELMASAAMARFSA